MLCVTAKTVVKAPLARVFASLIQVERWPWYDGRVAEVFVRGGTPAGGIDAEMTGRFGRHPYRADVVITPVRGRGVRVEVAGGPIPAVRCEVWLRPVAGGTAITREEIYRFADGPLGWLADVWWRAWLQAQVDRSLRALAFLIESEVAVQGETTPLAA